MRQATKETARLLAAAAAAAFAVAALAPLGAEPARTLEDVQIGERGAILKVALICSARCEIVPGDSVEFRLVGVAARLDIDLSARSALARRLTITPSGGASILKIDALAKINAAHVVDCDSDSGPAPCIEFRFEQQPAETALAENAPRQEAPPSAPKPRGEKTPEAAASAAPAREEIPFIGAIILAPRPALRDAPAEGLFNLPEFAPPERLAPRSPPADNEDIGALPANIDIGRPAFIAVDRAEALGEDDAFDLRTEAIDILGQPFDIGACEGAKARLAGDAWALDAMIDLAFCKAADGKLEAADTDFARLLAYTPDNYEALVGRGLIAFATGERDRGQALFQEALNALPPIEESDRIVAAMERN